MVKTSSVELHLHVPHNTVLVARKYDRDTDTAVLIIPDFGETILHGKYDVLCESIPFTTYLLELRGHGHSEGQWTVAHHLNDVQVLLQSLSGKFRKVFIIAHGITASLLLEWEHQQHLLQPAGMLLVAPEQQRKLGIFSHTGACRTHPRLRADLASFTMRPVRVQTPTIIFSDPAHPILKSIFGPVKVKRIQPSISHFLEDVLVALRDLQIIDVPIRFTKAKLSNR